MSAPTHEGDRLPSIRIATVNSAAGSIGSIHDDEKAREMGYSGGFVPGVAVLGYMTSLMNEVFGADWLRSGHFTGRLRRPTYAGVEVTVEGSVVEAPGATNGGRVHVALHVLDPDGQVTAQASAGCTLSDMQRS